LKVPNLKLKLIFVIALIFLGISGVGAQDSTGLITSGANIPPDVTPVMVKNVTTKDNPDDAGGAVIINWDLSADDHPGGKVTAYNVLRSENKDQGYTLVGEAPSGTNQYIDNAAPVNISYYYKVAAINALKENGQNIWTVVSESDPVGPIKSTAQWFDFRRINVFVGTIIICSLIIFYINRARSGKAIFIRKIAGLDAVDEAVGRATEMGKKIFFIPGTSDMDNVQTLAGITILGRVAQMAAEYETWIEVPVSRSLVLVTAREIVKEAYAKAGRPDAFREEQVHYLTDDQFGYAAGIDGMVIREKPATIFLMGNFYAESLILAETGNSIGAIQIAGTGQPSQLPFFVAACDYTLIGEELFAASAYLSREPKLLGSLKGQDVGKALILIAILLGVFLETFGIFQLSQYFSVLQ
jgi:hypothetical protein